MENYLAVAKVKGAKTASKASFSCEGVAAAIRKMCELLQTSVDDIEEYDLMELIGAQTLRIVAKKDPKKMIPWKPKEDELEIQYEEVEYISYQKGIV